MKIKLILFMLFLAVHSSSYAQEELTVEKKAAVNKLLEMTGAMDIGTNVVKSIVGKVLDFLKQSNPEISSRAFTILEEDVNALIREEMGAYFEMLYPIYHKYYTLSELNGLISFYETPLGSKVVSTLPLLTQESMLAGQKWGETLTPKIQEAFRRLQEERIEK